MFKHLRKMENDILQKVTWFSNRIYIEKYIQLMSMSGDTVETTNYIISGKNLKVNSFDGHILEIIGNTLSIQKKEIISDVQD